MPQSVEISVARMEEQMKMLLADSHEAKIARKKQYEKSEEQSQKMEEMNGRLKVVENQLASHGPTLAEFVMLKHRIQGAGFMGRWLWALGGVLIASAAWIAGLKGWFMGN